MTKQGKEILYVVIDIRNNKTVWYGSIEDCKWWISDLKPYNRKFYIITQQGEINMTKLKQKLLELGYKNSKDNCWDYIKTPYNGVKIIISLPSSFCNSAIYENAYIEVNKYIIFYKDDIEDLIDIYTEFEKDLKELKQCQN